MLFTIYMIPSDPARSANTTTMRKRFLERASICILFLLSGSIAQSQTMTVCELISSLGQYNGQMVTVRGLETGGEGLFLSGTDCRKHLITDGYVWPDAISIIYSSARARLHDVEFESDMSSEQGAIRAIKNMGYRKGDKVFVSITGVLETYEDLRAYVSTRNGKKFGMGFGHDNYAPAQLILKRVGDPEIERCRRIKPGGH